MSNFYTPPSPLFLSVRMSLNYPAPSPLDIKTQATNHPRTPILFGILAAYRLYLVEVSIRFRATHNSLQKNSSKHVSLGMLKIKPKCCLKQNQKPVWNTYSRTRHQSGTLIAEPDTCLEHWILITVILIIALDIQFLRIPSLSPPL